jgi:hypothetical protein
MWTFIRGLVGIRLATAQTTPLTLFGQKHTLAMPYRLPVFGR